jgi:PAP2 superfamily
MIISVWRQSTLTRPRLLPAERFILGSTLLVALVSAVLVSLRGTQIDWAGYLPVATTAVLLLGLGHTYRTTGRSDPIANTAFSVGLFMLFTAFASAFSYALLPVRSTPIDPWLAALDGQLGFYWPSVMQQAANWPVLAEILRWCYMSGLVQFAIIILLLGMTGRTRSLHHFMLTTTICSGITIATWMMFPSFGTSTLYELPPDVLQSLRPIVGTEYGRELQRLATEGPAIISPRQMLGVIAAPSFHTVMALTAVHATLDLRLLRVPFVLVNVMVLPATIVHGGHHLVDILAGGVVAAIGIYAAHAILGRGSAAAQSTMNSLAPSGPVHERCGSAPSAT